MNIAVVSTPIRLRIQSTPIVVTAQADAELVRAAISAYVLIGVTWSFFYALYAHFFSVS